jgi:hypothetical protein
MARLSKLIGALLHVERESPDKREVIIDAISETRRITGIREEADKVIILTKERDDNSD